MPIFLDQIQSSSFDDSNGIPVLIELESQPGSSIMSAAFSANQLDINGLIIDNEFTPVAMPEDPNGNSFSLGSNSYLIRATLLDIAQLDALQNLPNVIDVCLDCRIAPFITSSEFQSFIVSPQVSLGAASPCPIPPCDCQPSIPKGTIADIAKYLEADKIWASGYMGDGIVVGVLDSGITALGRHVKPGETSRRIPNVIGGHLSDWGTESSDWGDHGNMCATDVLGIAPNAQLYDLRVSGSGGSPATISRAIQAYNWALTQHRSNGTPHILTNSWGIFQESWDPNYATNPNHQFTRLVRQAINQGIINLFAAGNCGDTCADGRCGSDVGSGRSIWGANGEPLVITVGAVNKNEEFIGYSSRGPAALDNDKPDFCSLSHFTGYFTSDSGTSAATPIAAGLVALLKQKKNSLNQNDAKNALKSTAKDIGSPGFDRDSGSGVIQGKKAFDSI